MTRRTVKENNCTISDTPRKAVKAPRLDGPGRGASPEPQIQGGATGPPGRSTSPSKAYTFLPALIAAILGLGVADVDAQRAYKVVVHTDSEISELEEVELANIFLKRRTSWKDGTKIQPVDHAVDSPIREDFSRQIHRRSAWAIKNHWRRQIYSGRAVPPPEQASDAAVLKYVRETPGAIGYVSSGAPTAGVRVVRVIN